MRRVLQVLALLLFAAALALPLSMPNSAESQAITEALTTDMDAKTDDLFNGFGARGTPIDECVAEPVAPTARGNGRFEDNLFIFSERETIADGLGPTYNDVACVSCHQSVDVGAFSQEMEFRAGHITNGQFVDAPGGQLVHARGTDSDIVEHISTAETVKAFRITTSALGDGFVECIANQTLQNNVAAEPAAQQGTLTAVPVVEANNTLRIGRFGWKAQHASLQSFAGDAYLNEMGITNPFDGGGGTSENPCSTAEGVRNCTGAPFDPVADPKTTEMTCWRSPISWQRLVRRAGRIRFRLRQHVAIRYSMQLAALFATHVLSPLLLLALLSMAEHLWCRRLSEIRSSTRSAILRCTTLELAMASSRMQGRARLTRCARRHSGEFAVATGSCMKD
jgi:hypothetical protein